MKRIVAAAAAVALMVLAAGCSSSGDSSSSAAASPSPSMSATGSSADAVAWAGEVCTQMDRVKTSVGALGGNLSYDMTADRSTLEQIQRQLTLQVLALGDAASALQSSLSKVPVDFVAANDMIVALQKTGADTKDAANQVGEHLKAATEAGNVLAAAAEVGQAFVAAKAAFEAGQAFVSEIGSATSTANTELRAAFDAAPQCASL